MKLEFYCFTWKDCCIPFLNTYSRFDFGDLYNEIDACCRLRDGFSACWDAPENSVVVHLAVRQFFLTEKFRPVKPAFMKLPCLLNKHMVLRFPWSGRDDLRQVWKRNWNALISFFTLFLCLCKMPWPLESRVDGIFTHGNVFFNLLPSSLHCEVLAGGPLNIFGNIFSF